MISLLDYKKLLGSVAEGLTDEQIGALRAGDIQFADAIIDRWLRKRDCPPETLANPNGLHTIVSEHNKSPEAFLVPEISDTKRG